MPALRFASTLCLVVLVGGCAVIVPGSRATPCSTARCIVAVTVVGGAPVLTPDALEIVRVKKAHIIWKLPADYEFDTSRGDGVQLKGANDGEFSEMFETDDEGDNPAPARRPAPNFHWRDENSKANPVPYHYKIQFRKKGTGETYFKDPIIINSG